MSSITLTRVVNLHKEQFDIRIDRLSKWGNPYKKEVNTPAETRRVCDLFEEYFWKSDLPEYLHALAGKRLGCHCAPNLCHGNFLADETNMMTTLEFFNRGPEMVGPTDQVKVYWHNDVGKPIVRLARVVSLIPGGSHTEYTFAYTSLGGREVEFKVPANRIFAMTVLS